MSARTERFHFIDLLSLHFGGPMDIPNTRGLLALLRHLTDVPLPHVALFPPEIVAECRELVHGQFPWLRGVRFPSWIPEGDWAMVWAWVDTVQRRHGMEENGWGTTIEVKSFPVGRFQTVVLQLSPEVLFQINRALREELGE